MDISEIKEICKQVKDINPISCLDSIYIWCPFCSRHCVQNMSICGKSKGMREIDHKEGCAYLIIISHETKESK